MIEDKGLGVKIAENPIETLWSKVKMQSENELKVLKDSMILNEAILNLAISKLQELGK